MTKLPKAESPGESAFALHCRAHGLKFGREWRFAPPRRWRFDFAMVGRNVAVEIEGGTWSGGRHTWGAGYEKDLEKYNAAAKLGWIVLRYTTAMVLRGDAINDVLEMLQ